MKMSEEKRQALIKKYQEVKDHLGLKERYLDAFEYRNGINDGIKHTLKETGQKFGYSSVRAAQFEARVFYSVEEYH